MLETRHINYLSQRYGQINRNVEIKVVINRITGILRRLYKSNFTVHVS